jgi:hypothetical protein
MGNRETTIHGLHYMMSEVAAVFQRWHFCRNYDAQQSCQADTGSCDGTIWQPAFDDLKALKAKELVA